MHLLIPGTPTKDNEPTSIQYCVDPLPSGHLLARLEAQPGLQAFTTRATRLADATEALQPFFERHDEDFADAAALLQSLRQNPPLPAVANQTQAWSVRRQIEAIEASIMNGVLPREEDLPERRAFWSDRLSRVRTSEGLERLVDAVEDLLAKERSPDRELALINVFQEHHQDEQILVVWEPIVVNKGADAISTCVRWQELVAFGRRFIARRPNRGGGEDVIRLQTETLAQSLYGGHPLALQWGELLRETTRSLAPHADSLGYDAPTQLALSKLVQGLDAILAGKEVAFEPTVRDAEVLVSGMLDRARRSRQHQFDRLHEDLVVVCDGLQELAYLLRPHKTLARGLMFLDEYVARARRGDESPGLGMHEDIAWHATVKSLLAHLDDAHAIWTVSDASLRREITRVGKSAKFAMLHEASQHELVIRAARILLGPHDGGVVPAYCLDAVGPGFSGQPSPNLVRLRMAEALVAGGWPRDNSVDLAREYGALNLAGPQHPKVGQVDSARDPEPWPPPEHPSVRWLDLSEMERDYLTALVNAGKHAVCEVPRLARAARGRDAPNRHDKETAASLDAKGLTVKVGRTGRRLIAIPLGTPRQQ